MLEWLIAYWGPILAVLIAVGGIVATVHYCAQRGGMPQTGSGIVVERIATDGAVCYVASNLDHSAIAMTCIEARR